MTPSEQLRENPRAVLAANFNRIGEALRSLEEYTKLVDIWLAGRFEVLRYDIYTLEKLTMTAVAAHRTLSKAKLMVLIGGMPTIGDLTWTVGEALAAGADVIQYREKGLPDRELLRRPRNSNPDSAGAGSADLERPGGPGAARELRRRARRPGRSDASRRPTDHGPVVAHRRVDS